MDRYVFQNILSQFNGVMQNTLETQITGIFRSFSYIILATFAVRMKFFGHLEKCKNPSKLIEIENMKVMIK